VTGIYETKAGERGRFLLILTVRKRPIWKPVFFAREPGKATFSALSLEQRGALGWWTCTECDSGIFPQWNKILRRYEWEPDAPDDAETGETQKQVAANLTLVRADACLASLGRARAAERHQR
jgi:hypothetical protein